MASMVFIDARVQDYQSLIAGLASDTQVVILDPTRDGVVQVATALTGVIDLDSIHIISHGSSGTLYLGSIVLTEDNFDDYEDELAQIGASLGEDGDLLLYGCNAGAGTIGESFIASLAEYTGADVAASDDATGSAALGGDWVLEQRTGTMESGPLIASAAQARYVYVLDMVTGTSGDDSLTGTAGDDFLEGLDGDDSLSGLDGSDTLEGGLGSDTMRGGAGFDVASYAYALAGVLVDLSIVAPQDVSGFGSGVDVDVLTGIEGIIASQGGSSLLGNDNANLLLGGAGGDYLIGYGGDDTLDGGATGDILNGFTGNDILEGGSGGDSLIGYTGNDALDGGAGPDTLDGGLDNDTLTGAGGNDRLDGYGDSDTATYGGALSGYVFATAPNAIVVSDIHAGDGNEGVDHLISIEAVAFADAVIQPSLWQEVRISSTQDGDQADVTLAGVSGGGFVAAWTSSDGSNEGIFAQRVSASGEPLGGEFRVNTGTSTDQSAPAITALTGGGFVVAWQSDHEEGGGSTHNVFAQRYDANGATSGGEFRVNTTTANDQSVPALAALENGGFVAAWQSLSQDGGGYGVYAQRFNASGAAVGGEFRVNTTTANNQSIPALAALDDGGFVAAWQSLSQDGGGYGVYAQRFNANGATVGGEFRANTTTANEQSAPTIVGLSNGGFVVAWQALNQDGGGYGVYAQRFNANGAAAGGEFLVNTTTVNDQAAPAIAALDNGGFVVTWHSYYQDGGGGGIYARAYNAAGAAVTSEFGVNANTLGDQRMPAVTVLESGGFLVAWQSFGQSGDGGFGIYGQRYSDSADPVAGEITGNNGSNVITWVDSDNVILGGAGGNDTLSADQGNDTLNGGAGVDSMWGGSGNDTYLVDRAADRVMETSNGPGPLLGDPAPLDDFTDTVVAAITYSLEDSAFVENLTLAGTASSGTGNLLNNVITGNALANTLKGLGGADTLVGSGGKDTLTGGAGADLLRGNGGGDRLTGEGGADTFEFATTLNATSNVDRVMDFAAGVDQIQLDRTVFTKIALGDLAAGAFYAGAAAHDASDRIVYNTNTGGLYYDADGSAIVSSAILIATLAGAPAVAATDFFIVA